MHYNLYWKLYI